MAFSSDLNAALPLTILLQMDFRALAPDAYDVVMALGQAAAKAGCDKQLLELFKLRVSQINVCAFCVQYHLLQGENLGMSADKEGC